jgi:hypothetical protein
MGKHFIDPKSSEILFIFQVFPCTTQIALFWPKLLPALFLKKPWYPCPFDILEETLGYPMKAGHSWFDMVVSDLKLVAQMSLKWIDDHQVGQIYWCNLPWFLLGTNYNLEVLLLVDLLTLHVTPIPDQIHILFICSHLLKLNNTPPW